MPVSTFREKEILQQARTIAVVGHSDNPLRPSHRIASSLREAGYRVYAVNPHFKWLDGERVYPELAALPEVPDIVSIFRRSEYLLGHVRQAIEIGAPVVWAQLGVHDDAAVRLAESAGIEIITDKCIKVSLTFLLA